MEPQFRVSQTDRKKIKEEMRAIMVEFARAHETITYSDLARRLSTYLHYHSFEFARLLNEIGDEEVKAGRKVLPAVVVRKSSGIPGGGYFAIVGVMHSELDDLEAIWREDLDELFAYYDEN